MRRTAKRLVVGQCGERSDERRDAFFVEVGDEILGDGTVLDRPARDGVLRRGQEGQISRCPLETGAEG
jgi:hypothetical protein